MSRSSRRRAINRRRLARKQSRRFLLALYAIADALGPPALLQPDGTVLQALVGEVAAKAVFRTFSPLTGKPVAFAARIDLDSGEVFDSLRAAVTEAESSLGVESRFFTVDLPLSVLEALKVDKMVVGSLSRVGYTGAIIPAQLAQLIEVDGIVVTYPSRPRSVNRPISG